MGRACCCGSATCNKCSDVIIDLKNENYDYAMCLSAREPGVRTFTPNDIFINDLYIGDLDWLNTYEAGINYKSHWFVTSQDIVTELNRVYDAAINQTFYSDIKCKPYPIYYTNLDYVKPVFPQHAPKKRTATEGIKIEEIPRAIFNYSRFLIRYGDIYEKGAYHPSFDCLVRMNKTTKELCYFNRYSDYDSELGFMVAYQPYYCDCKGKRYTKIIIEISGVLDEQFNVGYDGYVRLVTTGSSLWNKSYLINLNSTSSNYHTGKNICNFPTVSNAYEYIFQGGVLRVNNSGISFKMPNCTLGMSNGSFVECRETDTKASTPDTVYFSQSMADIHNLLCHSNPYEFHVRNSPGRGEQRIVYDPSPRVVYLPADRPKATIKIHGVE